jgi:2-dehydro-3-deoxygalactonokinase
MEPTPHLKSSSEQPQAEAAFVGIDWGSTRRRVMALDAAGTLLREFADDAGLLHVAGRWSSALEDALSRAAPLALRSRVVLSGMVGSAQGWHTAPYLDAPLPLDALGQKLFAVPDAPAGLACHIVPGVRWRHDGGHVDVMRGEETQLLGAVANGLRDAVVVLPGTHSKWVRLRDGRIEGFATYMTGELFALLSQHGTLAPVLRGDGPSARSPSDAEASGEAFVLRASQGRALSNALFGCRAAVVSGQLAQSSAPEYLSGVLIGSEWHDALDRFARDGLSLRVLGAPALAERYRRAARHAGMDLGVLDERATHHAAWRLLQQTLDKEMTR